MTTAKMLGEWILQCLNAEYPTHGGVEWHHSLEKFIVEIAGVDLRVSCRTVLYGPIQWEESEYVTKAFQLCEARWLKTQASKVDDVRPGPGDDARACDAPVSAIEPALNACDKLDRAEGRDRCHHGLAGCVVPHVTHTEDECYTPEMYEASMLESTDE